MSEARRRRGAAAFARGRRGEMLAVGWLRLLGWRILHRNLKTPFGEIDLLARRGSILAVIEVKIRDDLDRAAEAIQFEQQARLLRAGAWIQGKKPRLKDLDLRFDALLIRPWRLPLHVQGAWMER
ncbi:YraN family protein [Lacibacterium aquatile]|uniref:UPF0102 protein ACFSM5_20380 n=1 Tax=Lacibacterium aquatile TaxID=1168082 RepID=A0ABW5DVW5_9PROT